MRAWLLVAAAPMTLASPAAALPSEPWSIAVEARECPGLDALRVRALFALELGRAAERLGDETVTVTCGPSETRLRIESSKTGWIERVLKTSLDREEPERIVALAAAQLVLAAWVEAPRTEGAVAPRAASLPAPESPRNPSAASTVSFDVELDAAVHARKVGAWAFGPAAGLSGAAWRGNWGASVGFDVDRIASSRALGTVELVVTELALAPAWRSSPDQAVAFELSLGPALAMVHLRGIDPSASVHTGTISTLTLDAKARAAMRYRGAGFSVGAALDGGYLVSGAEGTITSDVTVIARGPWVGLSVMGGATW